MSVFDLTRSIIQKNNLLFGYKCNDKNEVFLRAEVNGFRKNPLKLNDPRDYFDTVTANYVGTINDTTRLGLQVTIIIFRYV